ncbi:MAG: 16S rRNA (adenine(1518)-N(6)/adenine(1519)-N(6))-dimethyltransferase RsmA [Candidatus Micrarchaeota archaeon]|nr:16S rRNA (adenine(1518)-N(6)/adenine(1519)-N(6))-dimethyltransferase RsmA [Candidatus Micrarchaeota archaeon]
MLFKQEKHLSQVFLKDKNILKKEAETINPKNKVVMEIGGGLGNLSEELLKLRPKKLIIVEIDKNLAWSLEQKFRNNRDVIVINCDFLELNEPEIMKTKFDIICGNVPYHVSSDIIFKLLDFNFKIAYLLLQKEFVERIVDEFEYGIYSRLNIMTNYYFECKKSMLVNRTAFAPVPKVDSQLLILEKRNVKRNVEFENFVRILFTHKKKTLRNSVIDSYKEFKFEDKESAKSFVETLEFKDERVFNMNIAKLIITFKQFKEKDKL